MRMINIRFMVSLCKQCREQEGWNLKPDVREQNHNRKYRKGRQEVRQCSLEGILDRDLRDTRCDEEAEAVRWCNEAEGQGYDDDQSEDDRADIECCCGRKDDRAEQDHRRYRIHEGSDEEEEQHNDDQEYGSSTRDGDEEGLYDHVQLIVAEELTQCVRGCKCKQGKGGQLHGLDQDLRKHVELQ